MTDVSTDGLSEKSRNRKNQVLDAAAKCFRESGFHGSSIARISKMAGMSPGHIYYHFENKEAIVEALIARQENTILELFKDIAVGPSDEALSSAMARYTRKMVDHHMDPDFVGLWLEIAAESSRNPAVAKILHFSHKKTEALLEAQLQARTGITQSVDLKKLRSVMHIIPIIFNGLSVYSSIWSEEDKTDKTVLTDNINEIIDHFLKGL